MRCLHSLAVLAIAALLSSCTGMGVNQKDVYDKISGTSKLIATVSADTTAPTTVTFSIDGKALTSPVTTDKGTFSIAWDSTTVGNGIHTVKAVGQPGDVSLLDATIYVQNSGTAATPTAAP